MRLWKAYRRKGRKGCILLHHFGMTDSVDGDAAYAGFPRRRNTLSASMSRRNAALEKRLTALEPPTTSQDADASPAATTRSLRDVFVLTAAPSTCPDAKNSVPAVCPRPPHCQAQAPSHRMPDSRHGLPSRRSDDEDDDGDAAGRVANRISYFRGDASRLAELQYRCEYHRRFRLRRQQLRQRDASPSPPTSASDDGGDIEVETRLRCTLEESLAQRALAVRDDPSARVAVASDGSCVVAMGTVLPAQSDADYVASMAERLLDRQGRRLSDMGARLDVREAAAGEAEEDLIQHRRTAAESARRSRERCIAATSDARNLVRRSRQLEAERQRAVAAEARDIHCLVAVASRTCHFLRQAILIALCHRARDVVRTRERYFVPWQTRALRTLADRRRARLRRQLRNAIFAARVAATLAQRQSAVQVLAAFLRHVRVATRPLVSCRALLRAARTIQRNYRRHAALRLYLLAAWHPQLLASLCSHATRRFVEPSAAPADGTATRSPRPSGGRKVPKDAQLLLERAGEVVTQCRLTSLSEAPIDAFRSHFRAPPPPQEPKVPSSSAARRSPPPPKRPSAVSADAAMPPPLPNDVRSVVEWDADGVSDGAVLVPCPSGGAEVVPSTAATPAAVTPAAVGAHCVVPFAVRHAVLCSLMRHAATDTAFLRRLATGTTPHPDRGTNAAAPKRMRRQSVVASHKANVMDKSGLHARAFLQSGRPHVNTHGAVGVRPPSAPEPARSRPPKYFRWIGSVQRFQQRVLQRLTAPAAAGRHHHAAHHAALPPGHRGRVAERLPRTLPVATLDDLRSSCLVELRSRVRGVCEAVMRRVLANALRRKPPPTTAAARQAVGQKRPTTAPTRGARTLAPPSTSVASPLNASDWRDYVAARDAALMVLDDFQLSASPNETTDRGTLIAGSPSTSLRLDAAGGPAGRRSLSPAAGPSPPSTLRQLDPLVVAALAGRCLTTPETKFWQRWRSYLQRAAGNKGPPALPRSVLQRAFSDSAMAPTRSAEQPTRPPTDTLRKPQAPRSATGRGVPPPPKVAASVPPPPLPEVPLAAWISTYQLRLTAPSVEAVSLLVAI